MANFLKLGLCSFLIGLMPLSAFAEKGIVDEWYAHLTMDLMLGAKVDAAAIYKKRVPWLFYFYPSLKMIKEVPPGGFNPEEIVLMDPKYVILPISYKAQGETLEKAHIHVSVLDFKNAFGLLECVDQSAGLENTRTALARAQDYREFVTDIVGKEVLEKEKQAKEEKSSWKDFSFSSEKEKTSKPRILHLTSLKPLTADGVNTIVDEWISLAGGQNALRVKGNNHALTWEEVFSLNPDIIILAEGAGVWEKGTVPKGAEFLKAIKTGHLYRNPSGIYLWDRYGVELPLQILWIKAIIANQDPDSEEIRQKVKVFYEKFFALHPSEADIKKILKGEAPSAA